MLRIVIHLKSMVSFVLRVVVRVLRDVILVNFEFKVGKFACQKLNHLNASPFYLSFADAISF